MISSKFKALLFVTLTASNASMLVASEGNRETELDNLSNKSLDIIDQNQVNDPQPQGWFDNNLLSGLVPAVKSFLKENLQAAMEDDKEGYYQWVSKAVSSKNDKFYASINNLIKILISSKDIFHGAIAHHKESYDKHVRGFLDSIKSIYKQNQENITPGSKPFKEIMGLINGLTVYETLWDCFHTSMDEKIFRDWSDSRGLNKDECNRLCKKVLSDVKNSLSSKELSINGVSLWKKLSQNINSGKDTLYFLIQHDWYCYLVGTSVISGRQFEMRNFTPLVSDVNTCVEILSRKIKNAYKSVQEDMPSFCDDCLDRKYFLEKVLCDSDFKQYVAVCNKILEKNKTGYEDFLPVIIELFTERHRDREVYFVNNQLFNQIETFAKIKACSEKYSFSYTECLNNWYSTIEKNPEFAKYFCVKNSGRNEIDLLTILNRFEQFNIEITNRSIQDVLTIIDRLCEIAYSTKNSENYVSESTIYKRLLGYALTLYKYNINISDIIKLNYTKNLPDKFKDGVFLSLIILYLNNKVGKTIDFDKGEFLPACGKVLSNGDFANNPDSVDTVLSIITDFYKNPDYYNKLSIIEFLKQFVIIEGSFFKKEDFFERGVYTSKSERKKGTCENGDYIILSDLVTEDFWEYFFELDDNNVCYLRENEKLNRYVEDHYSFFLKNFVFYKLFPNNFDKLFPKKFFKNTEAKEKFKNILDDEAVFILDYKNLTDSFLNTLSRGTVSCLNDILSLDSASQKRLLDSLNSQLLGALSSIDNLRKLFSNDMFKNNKDKQYFLYQTKHFWEWENEAIAEYYHNLCKSLF